MKKITRILLFLIVALLCLSLTACGSTKVELAPYLSVSYTGYNGNGTPHIDFDFADFEYGIMSEWKGKDQLEKLGELTLVEMTITYAADVSKGLRNGDTITVKINFDEAKAKDWIAKGVQPTETVKNILVNKGIIAKPTKLSPAKTKVRKSK